jgi:phosphoribosylaminoimidazole-succinocarboxamide synthase
MVITETNIPELKLVTRGKVRDIYEHESYILLVATDRISAFDVVFPNGIPDKGKVLTLLSAFWFDRLRGTVPNHFVSLNVDEIEGISDESKQTLEGRTTIARKVEPIPVECVVRGYLEGSGWKDYQATGEIGGIALPEGLRQADRLPQPIFTPATKATSGHDENIGFEAVVERVGEKVANELREASLAIFNVASSFLEDKGIILADTKFEFGMDNGKIVLIDEVLTPDSSRFWPRDQYQPGGAQVSFDKQYVREFLESSGWNKEPPAPPLPEVVVRNTSKKYRSIYRIVTGKPLTPEKEVMRAKVVVTLKRNVSDPQGLAIRKALHSLGFTDALQVRVGKFFEVELEGWDLEKVQQRVETMSTRLLSNPIIEDFTVEVEE